MSIRSPLALCIAVAATPLWACASPPPPRLPVAVLVRAPEREAQQIRAALSGEAARGVEIRFVELPSGGALPAPETDVELRLAAARKAYTLPDVPRCLAELGGDELL